MTIREIRVGTIVKMSSGKRGVVTHINSKSKFELNDLSGVRDGMAPIGGSNYADYINNVEETLSVEEVIQLFVNAFLIGEDDDVKMDALEAEVRENISAEPILVDI